MYEAFAHAFEQHLFLSSHSQMVEKFFKEHDLLSKFRGANQALESINANIAYLVRNLEALRSHFGFRQARKIVY